MDADTIQRAGVNALDEVGLDKLSMRLIADRLGVQVGGLYYYVPDKAALLRAMADQICEAALDRFNRSRSRKRDAASLCGCVRAELLHHRDSARVLAAAPLNASTSALALMELLIELLEAEVPRRVAHTAADTLLSYLTGFVLQEQVSSQDVEFPLTIDELRERYPRVVRAADAPEDATFSKAIAAIVKGFR